MIPRTFPSTVDENNRTKIIIYQVPSIEGLTQWVDYIPVKSPESESDLTLANTYANEGFMLTSQVNDIEGLVPFKDYIPVYFDSTANKVWSADNDGYIPMSINAAQCEYVDVKDCIFSDAANRTALAINSVNSGNNTGWIFA
jgi:hypothetical protein